MRGVPYVMKAIAWAAQTGCPCVDTTDGLHQPEGLSDMDPWPACDGATRKSTVWPKLTTSSSILSRTATSREPGPRGRMLAFVDSKLLRIYMDTRNTFIADRDPVAFVERFIRKVSHVDIKDVSESLARAVRGGQIGIAVSHCALGQGVNAENIRRCLMLLRDHDYKAALSIECEGQGGPTIKQSLAWLRRTLDDLTIP